MSEKAKEKVISIEEIEKAKTTAILLVDKFRKYVDSDIAGEESFVFSKMQETANAKQCALIACDLKMQGENPWEYNFYFYQQVKKQIEKL